MTRHTTHDTDGAPHLHAGAKVNTRMAQQAPTWAYHPPTAGKQFAAERIVLGISARSVARALGVWPTTLLRWEQSADPCALSDAHRRKWQMALATCAAQRRRELAHLGLAVGDLPQITFAQLLTRYNTWLATATPTTP